MNIAEIIEAIDAAKTNWTGVDWTTDIGPRLLDVDGMSVDECRDRLAAAEDRDEISSWEAAVEYVEAAELAAAEAAEFGDQAIAALRAGDPKAAQDALELAIRREDDYGDSPTWSRPYKLLTAPVDFLLRGIPVDLHSRIKADAARKRIPIRSWIIGACEDELDIS